MVCTNCGYKNETFVNTLLPLPASSSGGATPTAMITGCKESFGNGNGKEDGGILTMSTGTHCSNSNSTTSKPSMIPLPLADAVVLGPLELNIDLNLKPYENGSLVEKGAAAVNENNLHLNYGSGGGGGESDEGISPHLIDETTTPLVRTVSLPTIQDTVTVPISVVVQPDPAFRPTVVLGNLPAEVDLGCKMLSMSNLEGSNCIDVPVSVGGSPVPAGSAGGNGHHHLLPRSRSLMTCRTHKVIPPATAVPRLQLFRNLQFARTNMFHVSDSNRYQNYSLGSNSPLTVISLPFKWVVWMVK